MDNSNVQRLIGIDFGTSTSLIRCKRYQNGQPIGDNYSVSAITYGNGVGDSKAVTLVRHNADDTFTCGRYGEEKLENSTVYREFKMDLENPNPPQQNLAKALTREFFKYLYERYDHQRSDLGQSTDEEQTVISFPAKWKRETRAFMEAVAAEAGFVNVTSMDEPSAALYAVFCRKMDELIQAGVLRAGNSGYVLLVDMGAGTTDLAVCRYQLSDAEGMVSAADGIKIEIISTWPDHSSDLTFGGREVDRILEDYLIEYLMSCGFNEQMCQRVVRGVSGVKAWKEDTVSLLLAENKTVTTCSCVSQYIMLAPEPQPFPAFDREKFQQIVGPKLDEFKKLVMDCLSVAGNQEPELVDKGIDLVVLTGGHSSWYFTSELLDGTMPGIDHPVLARVQQEKNRVIRLTNPQETVALGMVYSRLPFDIEKKEAPTVEQLDEPEEPDTVLDTSSLKEFIMNYKFAAITPMYSGEMLAKNLNIPSQAQIYRAFDATIFGSSKNGTIFTNQGIYCRGLLGNPTFCSWKELGECLIRFGAGTVYAHDPRSHIEKEVGVFTTMDENIKAFYRQLKKQAGAEVREDPVQLNYAAVNYEYVLSKVLGNFNAGNIALITGKTNPALMRTQLRIPASENIYLAHDDTWFHMTVAGSVLTGNGIYTKSNGPIIFVSWMEFAVGTLEPSGNDIILKLPDGSQKLAGRFSLCRPQAIALYLELQKAFREAADTSRNRESTNQSLISKFLEIYDLSGLRDTFAPAHITALRKECEAHVGEIYLAYRNYTMEDGTTYWFWFAIGEQGIYTSKKELITWEQVRNGHLLFRMNKQVRPVESCLNEVFFPNSYIHCYLDDTLIPASDSFTSMLMGAFFLELKRYLNDPDHYSVPSYQWTEKNKQELYGFVQANPYAGLLKPYAGDPALGEFLNCEPYAPILLQAHNGKLKSNYAWAGCMDDQGFRRRRNKGGAMVFTPYTAFLNNQLWMMVNSTECYFFAGSHYLFGTNGGVPEGTQTFQYLKVLQQYLRQQQ